MDVIQAFLTTAGFGGARLSSSESTAVLAPVQLGGGALALAWVYKGKRFAAILGVFVPLIALIGSVRLAYPDSRWAHRFYSDRRLDEARHRFPSERAEKPVVGAQAQPLA